MRRVSVVFVVALVVSGCANQGLRQLQSNSPGPDEFLVDPKKELVIPEDVAALPPPTPGQANRTDPDTYGELVTALGGRSTGDATGGIPSSDGALVTAASRFGVTQDIRATLAAEDAEFRRGQQRFSQFKLFPEDVYNRAYRKQALDARAEAEAWRRAGADTPSFPPR